MVNCHRHDTQPTARRTSASGIDNAAEPLELDQRSDAASSRHSTKASGRKTEAEERGAGGRQVLGTTLSAARARCGSAYTAWSAGRTLAGQPLTSPAIAQWIAVAAGPLALMGLAWLMFGRTRRKEAERFTRSVIAMRAESAVARSACSRSCRSGSTTAGPS